MNHSTKKKLRIGINAQIPSNSGAGGIETVLRVLTELNRYDESGEEYVFIGHWADCEWLEPLLGERQTLVRAPHPARSKQENLKRLLGKFRPLVRGVKNLIAPSAPLKTSPTIPVSDGFYESLDCDVIHFPYQDYVGCSVPTVYNPHDLQHLHYPQFFTPKEIERREIVYPAACRAAQKVVVASEFIKQDVVKNYRLEPAKIQVVSWSPPAIDGREYSETEAQKLFEKYLCPPRPFALYPAMTWEHKNHLRLLEAIHYLRENEGLTINLVCTGDRNSFYAEIEKRLRDLKLESQICFTGIIDYKELSIFYREARFVIVPTLFEALSAPLFEAWQHGTAVACSSVTSLPEQAADAALLFDPFSVEEIAQAVKKMTLSEQLRTDLRRKGTKRLQHFTPERTARAYLNIYRQAATGEMPGQICEFEEN